MRRGGSSDRPRAPICAQAYDACASLRCVRKPLGSPFGRHAQTCIIEIACDARARSWRQLRQRRRHGLFGSIYATALSRIHGRAQLADLNKRHPISFGWPVPQRTHRCLGALCQRRIVAPPLALARRACRRIPVRAEPHLHPASTISTQRRTLECAGRRRIDRSEGVCR